MEIPTQQQSLCLSCGICCDGTLFGRVPLQPRDDLPTLEKHGIEILTNGEKKSFKLGCVKFENQCCGIYADRPANCRSFRCELLKKFENGKVSWSDARKKIERAQYLAQNLKSEISKNMPEHEGLSVPALLRLAPEQEKMLAEPLLFAKWATVMMSLAMLRDGLQNHFQSPRNKDCVENLEKV